ncbi:MAG: hypothetical protein JO211_03180 [Acidobacteriaceae bacterium]|nr:hypothetical protein [Acidobacteriaceae bacterium]
MARQALARDPLSNFLREELDEPDLAHLGADPNRVLCIAAQYMRLGMYSAASGVLSRAYPPSPPQESEPGSVLPQQHVLVAYFNAYCRERLGKPAAQDYAKASELSTLYAFPAGAEALEVLKVAVQNNDSDATAHYLLGTLLFSQGEVDEALVEWQSANKLAPSLPVLDANIGRALLHVKNDPLGALGAFRRGISADSKNPALYTGIDQALSILKHPPHERAQELSRHPDLAHMPSDLLYELILNRAEAGDFDGAIDLFRNRFFPRQEGGTNVRQVWLEVQLQEALSLAKLDHCDEAVRVADQAGDPVASFAFTKEGLQPLLHAARSQYILGLITERCGRQREARQHFENAMQQTDAGQIFWAYAAARKLDENAAAQWRPKLERALEEARANSETSSYTSLWVYDEALLESALDQPEADASFVRALLLPDRMLAHHLSRLARAQLIPE